MSKLFVCLAILALANAVNIATSPGQVNTAETGVQNSPVCAYDPTNNVFSFVYASNGAAAYRRSTSGTDLSMFGTEGFWPYMGTVTAMAIDYANNGQAVVCIGSTVGAVDCMLLSSDLSTVQIPLFDAGLGVSGSIQYMGVSTTGTGRYFVWAVDSTDDTLKARAFDLMGPTDPTFTIADVREADGEAFDLSGDPRLIITTVQLSNGMGMDRHYSVLGVGIGGTFGIVNGAANPKVAHNPTTVRYIIVYNGPTGVFVVQVGTPGTFLNGVELIAGASDANIVVLNNGNNGVCYNDGMDNLACAEYNSDMSMIVNGPTLVTSGSPTFTEVFSDYACANEDNDLWVNAYTGVADSDGNAINAALLGGGGALGDPHVTSFWGCHVDAPKSEERAVLMSCPSGDSLTVAYYEEFDYRIRTVWTVVDGKKEHFKWKGLKHAQTKTVCGNTVEFHRYHTGINIRVQSITNRNIGGMFNDSSCHSGASKLTPISDPRSY